MKVKNLKKLLFIIMLIVCVMIPSINASAANTYNSSLAVNYASTHWNDGVGLCATFVSNCLKAGGCSASSSTVVGLWNALKNGGWGNDYILTRNGAYTYASANSGKLSAGDPIFFYCKTCGSWQHVVICSGFDSSGKAKAYAHNAAWNDKTFGNFVDAQGHTGSSIVYYSIHMSSDTSNNSSHQHNYSINEYEAIHPHKYYKKCNCGDYYYTGETAKLSSCSDCNQTSTSVTITVQTNKNEISNNNAIVHCNLNKPSGYAVTKIGIRVRKDGSNYNSGWSHYQTPTYGNYSTNTSVPISWNFKSELGFTPIHATKYYYQFYVVVNGKEYWSEEFYITTTGSHSYPSTWTTTKSATCTESGSAKRSCSCGKTETKTLSALGHNYSSSWTTDIAASCTTTGTKSHHCTRCSAKSMVTTIEATGHNWSSWKTTTEATCTSYGKQERTCSICSTKDFQNINPKGHTYSGTYTIDSAATCIAAGTKSKHCQNCSSKSSVTTINPTGHNWSEFTAISTATTEKQGISQRNCLNSGCSATESKSIPKLAIDGHTHAFAEWYNLKTATCTEQGEQQRHCTICSAAEKQTQAALGHNFGEWNEPDENGVIKRICSSCGNTEEQTSVIIPEEPTNNTQPTDTPIFEQTTTSENTEATQESNNLPYVVVGIILLLGGAGTAGFVVFKKKKSFNKPLED